MTAIRTVALAMLLLAGGCSRPGSSDTASADAGLAREQAAVAMQAPTRPGVAGDAGVQRAGQVDASSLESTALTAEDGQRRFIRTVSADFQVSDVTRAARRIEDLAARAGGFVTRSDIGSDVRSTHRRPLGDGRRVELSVYVQRANLQLRVPSAGAQAFMRSLAREMDFLDRRSYQAVDAQFELLRQQLARARHADARRQLARAAQAGAATDAKVDAIGAASGAAQARDEALLAQRIFEDQVAFATIDLSMHQPERVRRSEVPDVSAILEREGPGFFRRAGAALASGWTGLLDVLVALAVLWPLWLTVVLALLAWHLRRLARRG